MESLVNAVSQVPLEAWLIIGISLAVMVIWLGYKRWSSILGFGPHEITETETHEYDEPTGELTKTIKTTETQHSRTFWDWMALLTISAVIAAVALIYSQRQAVQQRLIQQREAEQQRLIQQREAQDAAFQSYLDQMSVLILQHNLSTSKKDDPVRDVARSRTLTVVRRQGPEGKADVVNFLHEAGLIKADKPIVSLIVAHLEEARLRKAKLPSVNLSNSYLQKADFYWANLDHSDLYLADLHGANLRSAGLKDADLSYADLSRADLSRAEPRYLGPTDLKRADLSRTDLSKAKLRGADLTEADLSGAVGLTEKQLTAVKTLEGATMPDGLRLKSKDNPDGLTFEEWLKRHEKENSGS